MPVCLLGLGSNLGDRTENLDLAVQAVGSHEEIGVLAASRYYATHPIGGPSGQGEFLNAAVRLETSLSPQALMQHVLGVEGNLGRRRTQRWGARTVDLDILLYGEEKVESTGLRIPHPRMAFRRFVLEPAAEIAADMVHADTGWTVARLLGHLNTAMPYVAVAGLPGTNKKRLATVVAQRTGARVIRDPLTEMMAVRSVDLDSFFDSEPHCMLLERRRQVLDRDGPAGQAIESISDFWFEQTAAYAAGWLSATALVRYRELHKSTGAQIVFPKLLVLLDVDPQQSAARSPPATSGSENPLDERRLAAIGLRLKQAASVPGRHPVLRLAAEDFSRAADEVVAAIETMR